MKYGVICNTVTALVKEVNEAIANGWKPIGGATAQGNQVMQAMVKEDATAEDL